jgi:hypothetical protein
MRVTTGLTCFAIFRTCTGLRASAPKTSWTRSHQSSSPCVDRAVTSFESQELARAALTKVTTRHTSEITAPAIQCVEPSALTSAELGDFQACVLSGDEVDARGLMRRLRLSFRLCSVRLGESLVAVGGLKNPGVGYRSGISKKSRTDLAESKFPLELGWVYVSPSARGKKLSYLVCEPLLAAAGRRGIFATSYSENDYMHRTLEGLGFSRAGSDWVSTRSIRKLCLFLRSAS